MKRTQKIDDHMKRYMSKVYEKEAEKRSQSLQRERNAEHAYHKKVENAYQQREGERRNQQADNYSFIKNQQVKNTLQRSHQSQMLDLEKGQMRDKYLEIKSVDQKLVDERRAKQKVYRDMLQSQIDVSSKMKLMGNMTHVEKQMNKDDL